MVTALQHGTWMDEEGFKKTISGRTKKGRHPPAFLRYMGSRPHSETGCRKVYAGEVSERQKNPMTAKETIGDGGPVAGNTPTASFLTKIGKMHSAGCRLCKIAREARGESTDGLADLFNLNCFYYWKE